MHHPGRADAVEGLHEGRFRRGRGESLQQRVARGEERQDAVHGRGVRDGVRGVDDDLAGEVRGQRADEVLGDRALDREDRDVGVHEELGLSLIHI